MKLPTAEQMYLTPASVPGAERVIMTQWHRRDVEPFTPQGVNTRYRAFVEVNHGRWIVHCPFCDGAQFASESDHRFFCVDCLNIQANRQFIEVVWPPNASSIEQELVRRPHPEVMNWLPTETVNDLHVEWNAVQELTNPENPAGIRPGMPLGTFTRLQLEEYRHQQRQMVEKLTAAFHAPDKPNKPGK